jgi:hypothetical protein
VKADKADQSIGGAWLGIGMQFNFIGKMIFDLMGRKYLPNCNECV